MMTENHIDRISIQVGLSGYSFKVESGSGTECSGWMGADTIFASPYLQHRYGVVNMSVFTPKCALVPSRFHCPEQSRKLLSDVVCLDKADRVDYVPVPHFDSVLVYSDSIGGTLSSVLSEMLIPADGKKVHPLPELYFMLDCVSGISDYNKIVASYADGYLYLVVAQGKTLLLCNAFEAVDFTTAQYYIFMVMKKLQLNPEMSAIYFRTPLDEHQEMSLYHYFRNVERI